MAEDRKGLTKQRWTWAGFYSRSKISERDFPPLGQYQRWKSTRQSRESVKKSTALRRWKTDCNQWRTWETCSSSKLNKRTILSIKNKHQTDKLDILHVKRANREPELKLKSAGNLRLVAVNKKIMLTNRSTTETSTFTWDLCRKTQVCCSGKENPWNMRAYFC